MGLLSNLKRRAAPPASSAAPPSEPADAVQKARARARQRLIGALVLVGIGVIGFPLVFETQPRPIPLDIPIEIPRREAAPSLQMPPARAPEASASSVARPQVSPVAEPAPAAGGDVATAPPVPANPESSTSGAEPGAASARKPATAAVAEVAPPTAPAGTQPAKPGADAARARALLEGKPPASADAARFVVQVGAFADAGAARETRLKAEKLGFKTYTQVASTSGGNRIRVRVGPFGTRDEAEKALAKARSAGLTAVVLTL